MATADAMTLITVLHQLLTFADAVSHVKGLHKLVTLAFISVTYFCFENKLVWKLTHSPPSTHISHFITAVKVICFGWPLLLYF